MPRNCWTRCNKTFPCSFLTREKTREIESRETSRRLEKQAISALLRKMIYKLKFVDTPIDSIICNILSALRTQKSSVPILFTGRTYGISRYRNRSCFFNTFFRIKHRRFATNRNKIIFATGAQFSMLHFFSAKWTFHAEKIPPQIPICQS